MKTKLLRYTDALAKAIHKGSHQRETTQQQFCIEAIKKELRLLGDEDIDILVDQHEANEAAIHE